MGLIVLILKLQENSPGCHADLFISRLTYNIFLLNYQIFLNVFYLAFCSPRAFLYFPLMLNYGNC